MTTCLRSASPCLTSEPLTRHFPARPLWPPYLNEHSTRLLPTSPSCMLTSRCLLTAKQWNASFMSLFLHLRAPVPRRRPDRSILSSSFFFHAVNENWMTLAFLQLYQLQTSLYSVVFNNCWDYDKMYLGGYARNQTISSLRIEEEKFI